MEAPECCPPEIYEIMRQVTLFNDYFDVYINVIYLFQAWHLLPERRPSFKDVKTKLAHLKVITIN